MENKLTQDKFRGKSNLTNFGKVYRVAIFRVDNLLIFILGSLFCIFFGKFFILGVLFLTFGIIVKAFILATKSEFIIQVLSPQKSFEIKNLIQVLTKELNKSYLEDVKVNFQSGRAELIKINKNLELITKNKNELENNLGSNQSVQAISFEKTGFDNLDFLPTVLPELVDKILVLSSEEQKIRKFLQTENKNELQNDLATLNSQALQNFEQNLTSNLQNTASQTHKKEQENDLKYDLNARNSEQIENKNNQLETILNFEKQLDQIENYLTQIKIELSAISLFTAKLSLPTKKITTDDYLLTNLNKLNLEIDTFTNQMNEIS